jgi:pimeloyl-ACP methyl ester carboxylesterase
MPIATLALLLAASADYARVIEDTKVRFGARLSGRLAVVALAGNAGRPVAIYVPRGFSAAEPARIVMYFHGIRTPGSRENGLIDRIASFGAAGNAIYVLPEGVLASRWPWPEAGMRFSAIEQEALAVARDLVGAARLSVGRRTIIAHSAGGKALALAARRGDLRVDKLVLLDCFYGRWHEDIARGIGDRSVTVDYYRSSNDPALAADFFRRVAGASHTTSVAHLALPGVYTAL